MALASALAGAQLLSLALLWPRANPNSPAGQTAVNVGSVREPAAATEPPASSSIASRDLLPARRSLQEPVSEYRPPGDLTLIDSVAPLRASRPIPQGLLN
jgi:hypothetical protein